ncbi:FabD/lysophospholipase-like protein [Macroventuria anomochaeta]|uniref:FabD/lysophospholipase-like protein n=1 Tax=Macroventuria anomochaeta TaxID=301207 RepID=A0ACB6SG93_9PLEO|nr:FabD/lysophospholipase-like protein [Macroventuria anomochaeta]KAF2633018.1 FabD/lysophospholipase-like protein [Macroventuria anomochaeta]
MDTFPWITLRKKTLTLHEPVVGSCDAISQDSKPSYVVLVGKRSKTVLLNKLLGCTSSLPVHRDVYLRYSPKLCADRTPLVIIDSGVQSLRPPVFDDSQTDGKKTSWTLLTEWNNYNAMLCAKVFSTFSSVICCFVNDLGGLTAVAEWLAEQINAPRVSDSPTLPRVLLVLQTSSDTFDESIATHNVNRLVRKALKRSGPVLAQREISRHFAGLEVVALQSAKSNAAQAKALKTRLFAMSKASMQERESAHTQFSFRHFLDLSKQVLHLVCSDPGKQTLYLARASRPCGFSTDLLEHCLTDFLEQIPSQAWLWHFVAPLIASALMLASYPPGAHAAISSYTANKQIQDQFLTAVLNEFRAVFAQRIDLALPAAEMHRQTLRKHHPHLADLKSHRSCFCCFMRMPEKVLACGHALSDSCVRIFGTRSRTEKNSYELSECVLCGVNYQNAVFRFVPPTAGIRRLSVDGGGVKGIIPLMFLQHINTSLAPFGLPVQDYFDIVCGTSAGGLVVIGLFLLRWSASESMKRFEEVAEKTFGKRATFISKVLRLLVAYVQDGQYSLAAIQGAFQKALNSPLQMFNPLRNDTKVAVTTTAVKDSSPWLFTNYNAGKRPKGSGYDIARAEKARDDISIGEAACCTSAAPWFFKPQAVGKLGTYQDGGLHHNCPSDMAQWETRFVWPSKPDDPDFALSLGTGTSSEEGISSTSRFLLRLLNCWKHGLNGQKGYDRFINSVPPKSRPRYHRLNIQFSGPEPSLDDALKIPEMKERVTRMIELEEGRMTAIFDAIIASLFYFELDGPPNLEAGEFQCSGHIYCRADLRADGLRYLYKQLQDKSSWFYIQGNPVRCVEHIPRSLPPFKRRVCFQVKLEDELISMSIRGITSTSQSISGFPTTVQHLIKIDHSLNEKPLPAIPRKRSRSNQGGRCNPKRTCSSVYST